MTATALMAMVMAHTLQVGSGALRGHKMSEARTCLLTRSVVALVWSVLAFYNLSGSLPARVCSIQGSGQLFPTPLSFPPLHGVALQPTCAY